MAKRYIDIKYLGQCETCRHHRSGKCDTWCECGECYRPDVSKIPIADVVEVVRCKDCKHKEQCCEFIMISGKDKNIDFHWFFVGNYLDNGFVESLIKTEGLQQEITVTGFVSNPYKYMEICDIYIQPSYEDAHATTVVEVAILNKPIISTDTSTGRLFRDKYNCCDVCEINADALAATILNLYNNPSEKEKLIATTKEIDYSKKYSEYKQALNDLFA
jgi:hypothetical protein